MIRTTVELTIEDIELILDNLGVEEKGEHHNKTALRRKLHEIMLALRERHMKRDNIA
ncbi:MAG: hypothetical protein M3Q44_02265 [bacterium]|nr:hypothetical protein [bacterium]